MKLKKENIPTSEEKKSPKKEKKLSKEQQKIQELEAQVEELKNDFLRSRADFENFRKRNQEELMQARDRGVISFVENLLPAIDNFEMSLKMTQNTQMFIKGVEMIHKNLNDILKTNKIEEFEAKVGDQFNPTIHDPLLIEDSNHKPGTIIGTIKKGYKHKDKIIRAARVQVVKDYQSDKTEN